MAHEQEELRRVRFFGPSDLATGWFVERAAELAERFDPNSAPTNTADIVELHNVQQYLEHGLLPSTYTEEQLAFAKARIPQIRSAVARYFRGVNETNLAAVVAGVEDLRHVYVRDLLDLLGRNDVYNRCAAPEVLSALSAAGVHLGELLGCKKLVQAYDSDVRAELLSSSRGAEYVIRKYLEDGVGDEIQIPRSLSPEDSRALLEQYIDREDANPNYIGLIASAKETPAAGIDARLKLRAKRRREELESKFFENDQGLKLGYEISIADQLEPVVQEIDDSDGWACRYSYSRAWLDDTRDNASILNNFIHLFEFIDQDALLVLPSYPSELGVFESLMGAPGRTEYKLGAAFRTKDAISLLQTRLYHDFLKAKDIELEDVFSWFFEEYLAKEFGAENFSFVPSAAEASYLQKVRHLFAEMESAVSQFGLFAKEGELDRDLLEMAAEMARYKDIPSLLDGKYLYPTDSSEIASILNLLFSDQSSIGYISDSMRGENGASLLLGNEVAYGDFHDHQRAAIDYLIEFGIVRDDGTRVGIVNAEQFQILAALFSKQCASYFHLSVRGQAVADAMVGKGWVERRSSLLSEAEANYFNYFLNAVDFSNGPKLRNKYLHGSQSNEAGQHTHFHTYMIALRLTVALVIKINDEFCLDAAEKGA